MDLSPREEMEKSGPSPAAGQSTQRAGPEKRSQGQRQEDRLQACVGGEDAVPTGPEHSLQRLGREEKKGGMGSWEVVLTGKRETSEDDE